MRAQRTQRTTERSLHVGMMMVLARYGWEHGPDARVWDEESRLARRAADLGVDCPWSAEHHCNDDAFVPDTLQLLTSLTALCPRRLSEKDPVYESIVAVGQMKGDNDSSQLSSLLSRRHAEIDNGRSPEENVSAMGAPALPAGSP
jgi:hypothetical protein